MATQIKTSKRPTKNITKLREKDPAKLRVRIATEALGALESKTFKAITDAWVQVRKDREIFSEKDFGSDLKDVLERTTKCEGCAVGGLFCAAVMLHDKFPINEMTDTLSSWHEDIFEYLQDYFDTEQLWLIESAFEGRFQNISTQIDWGQEELAHKFFEQHSDDAKRFAAIMQNIIRNNGTFHLHSSYVE